MDESTFSQLLGKFAKVREPDFQGNSCREYSLEEARAYRAKLEADREAEASKPQRKNVATAIDDESRGFFEAVATEMRQAGVKNVPEVLNEMREGYYDWLCDYNLEELENLIANKST